MAKIIDWAAVKADYLAENLMLEKQQPFSLKELSIRWKIAYKTIRNKASQEKWNDELQERITQQQLDIIQNVQNSQVESEVEIRQRQAQVTRYLMDKAMKKLISIPPDELTKREAIELIKFSLGEERKALGLADKHEISSTVNSDTPSVAEIISQHELGEALTGKLLSYLESDPCN